MIGPDGPRNAREEEEWLMQRQRENAEFEAHAAAHMEAQREWEEAIYLDQLDGDLDGLDKEIAALSLNRSS